MAALGGGTFVVVWAGDDEDGRGVFGRRVAADGTPLGAPFKINTFITTAETPGPNDIVRTAVSADAAGRFVVTWDSYQQDGSTFGVIGRRFDASATPLGPEFLVNETTSGHQLESDVAVHPSGSFVVSWISQFDVFARRYDADGTALSGEFPVADAGYYPRIAVSGNGDFLVVYGTSTGEFVGRRFDAGGTSLGGPFQVNETVALGFNGVDVAFDTQGGRSIVAWTGFDNVQRGIFARRYDAAGVALGGEFQVNVFEAGWQFSPAVAADPFGGFSVLWSSGQSGQLSGRRYDAAGVPFGGDFPVRVDPADGFNARPALAFGADGGFLVAWEEPAVGMDRIIRARPFSDPAEVPVAGVRLDLRDPSDPSHRRLSATATDVLISTSHSVGIDPIADGAFLQVFNPGSGESACFALPASGWTASAPPDPPTYTYRDPAFLHGPCHRALVKGGRHAKLTASCQARVQPIPFSLDEPQQGSLGVVFRSGGATYCLEFGGTVVRDSGAEGRFVAKKSPRPAACATPPAPCP